MMRVPSFLTFSLLAALVVSASGVISAREIATIELADGKTIKTPVEPLRQDPQIVKGSLDNGLTYYIRPNAEPKGRMSIRLRVATGSLNEFEENQGIAHFIEHLVFNGSKHFKRGELMPEMQRYGLGLGGDANAYTSFDETVYMIDLPRLDDKTTNLAFTIMRDFGDGALLEESAINAERGIIESEYKARDSASYRAAKESFAFLFKGTKIAERFPIGTLDFIRNGGRDLFLDYYRTQYNPARMQLILVGDMTADQARAWIDQYFGDMKKAEYTFKPDYGSLEVPVKQDAKWIANTELSSTNISLNNVRPYQAEKDTAAQRIEDMPLEVAMGMLNVRFSRMTEKEDCPFLSAGIYRDDLFKLVDIVTLSATTNEKNWKKALSTIEQEMRRAVQYGFSSAELDEISKKLVNAIEVRKQTWPTIKSDQLAGNILNAVGSDEIFTDPDEDLRILREGLDMLKNNPELCRQALEKAWEPSTLQTVVMSNADNADGSREILDCLKQSGQVKVEAVQQEELKPFAYDRVGEPGKTVSKTDIADMEITQLVLSNGVRVNLKSTEFSKNSISILFSIDGGTVTLPLNKPGLEQLALAVMNAGGLEKHSDDELSRLMAGRTVGVSFGFSPERLTLSGWTTPSDMELQLKLMAAHVLHPGYRPEGEMKFRRAIPLMYKRMQHDPNGVLAMNGMEYLLKGNPRFVFPKQQQIEQLTTEDVKSWVDPILKNGYLEVSVVGDFDREEVIALLEKTVGAMPKRPEQPSEIDHQKLAVELVPSGTSKDFDYPTNIDRTLVCTVWKTGDGFDRERTRRINLLQAILRERLFKGIREKMGEAYSPYVRATLSRTYPGLGYVMGICPGVLKNSDAVAEAVREIAADLGKGTIDQDELDRAKRPLINGFERELRNNEYWMDVIADSQADPEDIQLARTRIETYKNMTLEEINALAKEIFAPGNSLIIRILPDASEKRQENEAAGETQNRDAA